MAKLPTVKQMKFREYKPLCSGPPELWENTRYFRLNEGTTDYVNIINMPVSIGDTIEFVFLAPETTFASFTALIDGSTNDLERLAVGFSPTGKFFFDHGIASSLELDGAPFLFSSDFPIDGKLHSLKITLSANAAGRSVEKLLASRFGGINYRGVVFDFMHKSSTGDLLRGYSISDNSDTIVDSVGGKNGTVINGNPDDWGLFKKLPNGNWQGINLSAAWDSTDQILEFA